MTAAEIKEQIAEGKTQIGWLKEIAFQLALMNEHKPELQLTPPLLGKKHDRK